MFFPDIPNVSLVAFYGNKQLSLKLLSFQLPKYLSKIPLLEITKEKFIKLYYPY